MWHRPQNVRRNLSNWNFRFFSSSNHLTKITAKQFGLRIHFERICNRIHKSDTDANLATMYSHDNFSITWLLRYVPSVIRSKPLHLIGITEFLIGSTIWIMSKYACKYSEPQMTKRIYYIGKSIFSSEFVNTNELMHDYSAFKHTPSSDLRFIIWCYYS